MWISKRDFLRLNTRVLVLEMKVEKLLEFANKDEKLVKDDPYGFYSPKKSSMNESGLGKEL